MTFTERVLDFVDKYKAHPVVTTCREQDCGLEVEGEFDRCPQCGSSDVIHKGGDAC